jgi:N-methylhydantoinase B
LTQTVAAARVAYKLLISSEVSPNGGSFRPLEVKAPAGSIFAAQEPAACGWYFTPLGLLIDLLIKALSPVLPDKSAAAHYGDSMVITISGFDPRNDNQYYLMIEPTTGGWGASDGNDGASSLINNVNGSFKDLPVEVFESKYPLEIVKYGIRQDSGGAGKNRGGNGTFRHYRVLADSSLYLWFERSVTPAWGLFGGQDGAKPLVTVTTPDGQQAEYLKVNGIDAPAGTEILSLTGGGGGFGNPLERDPEEVRNDVLEKYTSVEHARSAYGVVLDDNLQVDAAATAELRAS